MKKMINGALMVVCVVTAAACAGWPKQGSAPAYQSAYDHRGASVGGFRVADATTAPLQFVLMARLDVPPAKAFDLVSRGLPEWVKQIPSVSWDHGGSVNPGTFGAGSVRQCSFGEKYAVENIRAWDEGKVYAYSVDFKKSTMSMPIKDHMGMFIIEDDKKGGSLVTWRQYFRGRFPGAAMMARFMMRKQVMDPALGLLIKKYGGERVQPVL